MTESRSAVQKWVAEEFTSLLAGIFELMAGERPGMKWEAATAAPVEITMRWRQPFSGADGAVWVTAADADWRTAAGHVLRSAGIEESDDATLRSTFIEVAGQALSGLAQALTGRLSREVLPEGGEERAAAPVDAEWISIRLTLGKDEIELIIGVEHTLIDILAEIVSAPPFVQNPDPSAPVARPHADSKTFELLLEVELPVSVSFGRAHMPLKEVLKLTTGSVVELNRSISQPVEVIVNNCVIARGEVVAIEGNFGVRIQHVVSRQERLRTLN